MYHESMDLWKNLLLAGLKEDGWPWDWTTLGTRKNPKIHARVIAKSEGIWAAEGLAQAIAQLGELQIQSKFSDGIKFQSDDHLLEISGNANDLLALERPFLNLAAYVCGVSTATHRIVEKVKQACPKNPPRVTLTRKTLPYYRDIAIHGVRVGGGFPHRVSLAAGILIKENHISAAGGIRQAVEGARSVAPHGLKIEIEVRSEEELRAALAAGAEGVLLDNFSPAQVHSALKTLENHTPRPVVEVSGGLNESIISKYAIPGVDILSLGSLTHSVKASDFSLLVHA